MARNKSLRRAINDKCKECIFDPLGGCGKWLTQVTNCTSYTCPLYEVRPQSRVTRCPDTEDMFGGDL